jgi:hypothetical protein
MTTATETKTLTFATIAALALGAPLEGGTFAGIITLKDGSHVAIALLADKPAERLKWADAKTWAESVDGVLPTRPVAAMLYANAKDQFEERWHWTSEPVDGSYAWMQYFFSGTQNWSTPASYLKCDLANFFVSIDKRVVLAQLQRRVHEQAWMALAETILMHDPRGDVLVRGSRAELALVPPRKSLFNAPDHHGLPIGNLSSQFFANVLLDDLDQFAKHQLRAPHYVRYVDDFVLVNPDPSWLHAARLRIEAKLDELHLQLNPRKTVLQPVARGVDFVGHVIRPWRRVPRPNALPRAIARIDEGHADAFDQFNSYFGLLRQSPASHHLRAQLANASRDRGFTVNTSFTKVYRKTAS